MKSYVALPKKVDVLFSIPIQTFNAMYIFQFQTHEEQVTLLQQVMAATDADIDEEYTLNTGGIGTSKSNVQRRNLKGFSSFSGADNDAYMEFKSKSKIKHPLFKKFKGK